MMKLVAVFCVLMTALAIAEESKHVPEALKSEEKLQVLSLNVDLANASVKQLSSVRIMEAAQKAYEDAQRDYNQSTMKINELQGKLKKFGDELSATYKADGYTLDEKGNWAEVKKQ